MSPATCHVFGVQGARGGRISACVYTSTKENPTDSGEQRTTQQWAKANILLKPGSRVSDGIRLLSQKHSNNIPNGSITHPRGIMVLSTISPFSQSPQYSHTWFSQVQIVHFQPNITQLEWSSIVSKCAKKSSPLCPTVTVSMPNWKLPV